MVYESKNIKEGRRMKKTAKLIALLLCVAITLTSCAPLIPIIMGSTDMGSHDNGPSNNGSSTPDYNGGSSNNGGSSSTTNSIKKEVQEEMDRLPERTPTAKDRELLDRINDVIRDATLGKIYDDNTLKVSGPVTTDGMTLRNLESYMDDNGAQFMKMDIRDDKNSRSYYDVMRYVHLSDINIIVDNKNYKYI